MRSKQNKNQFASPKSFQFLLSSDRKDVKDTLTTSFVNKFADNKNMYQSYISNDKKETEPDI